MKVTAKFPKTNVVFDILTSVFQLLNHPHLSAHIDETDEDALSYMTDLEVGLIEKSGYCKCKKQKLSKEYLFCVFPPD